MNENNSLKQPFVRKKKLQTMLERVTQEMYRRNLELAETNKTLSLLRKIDELALESQDSIEAFCDALAAAIAAAGEYPLVGVLVHSRHSKTNLRLTGLSLSIPITDKQRDSLYRIQISTLDNWFQGQALLRPLPLKTIPKSVITRTLNISAAELTKLENVLPVNSVLFVKLSVRKKLVGLLAVGFLQEPEQISASESQLFERLGEAAGVAVDNKLLFEENQHIVSQLQKTNEKLKALDEAKDEFISMASHQLRTPLTSVKGYLSMVLEGDAGKITKEQRRFLDQAFTSSQRMVYLIADLLNVSRLRTGKFVIEAQPTNLADVVEGEVNQLVEAAKARDLELIYEKPEGFPVLMLDETKIRQVVMNFVDNAIYYTPAGGHILVTVRETAESIEFIVKDDGLGVPRSEQQHLFTKFYRAGNARSARPDGTGLGLFMAKKVVIAQGGSLIFKSTEGKGSTFGFVFNKAKLKMPGNVDAPENG